MTVEDLREDLLDLADMLYPNLKEIKNSPISMGDMVDFVIYEEGIKKAYDNYAEKKSVRQHILDRGLDEDNDGRKLSRIHKYVQYYRDFQNSRLIARGTNGSEELVGKDMEDFESRIEGHEISDMNFYEMNNMLELPLLKKIIGKQIGDSKKVSNGKFVEYMDGYDKEMNRLFDSMGTPEEILFNTEAFFTCEWKYPIGTVYQIVLEAEKRGYPEFNVEQIKFILGEINIVPTTEWYPKVVTTECRMINARDKLIPYLFETDKKKYADFIDVCAEMYRLRDALKKVEHGKSIAELVVKTTLDDRVSFLKKHFWIWDNHVREKKWDAKKIKYARNIFNRIYLTVDEPSIK